MSNPTENEPQPTEDNTDELGPAEPIEDNADELAGEEVEDPTVAEEEKP